MRTNDEPVVVEQTFQASVDAVWRGITEVEQMRRWYFDTIASFEPTVGFETRFNVRVEETDFFHLWRVTQVEPLKMIQYNWKYEGYSGDSFVTFELHEQDDGTRLKLTHQVTESFPGNIAVFSRESGVAGWSYLIKESLKTYLESS